MPRFFFIYNLNQTGIFELFINKISEWIIIKFFVLNVNKLKSCIDLQIQNCNMKRILRNSKHEQNHNGRITLLSDLLFSLMLLPDGNKRQ